MSLSPFRFVEVGVKGVWLIAIGEIGIPRATVLCIRSKFGLFEVREVVGMGAALVWETMFAVSNLHRATREGSFDASALQSTL